MAIVKKLALFALFPLQALAGAGEAPLPGYKVVDLSWEVEVFPGKVENFTGTVEQVHHEVTTLNPQWEPPTINIDVESSTNEKRYTNWNAINCGAGPWGWRPCKSIKIQDGINYLRGLSGRPSNGPGPGACGRVSCSWNAAIWWCNDNRQTQTLYSWRDIADGAQLTLWKCQTGIGAQEKYVNGQAFAYDNWNVIVRKDDC
ncbi:hypothetical protein VFPPC_14002 [Pochonia chlamydosporia 170]|uniref:Uncharacterized protein n=1 Tax=Pochonia chlamydosporia 170 TaxID=1380566 RepID=A0A179FIR5_METCM|nr:hypothetical protein VFPPC_14002 [Pochonia chlamydosporia 170]OAQ65141.1 hypothetical protein VFPPC_14002 [Pochonia chlamydosporia 170]